MVFQASSQVPPTWKSCSANPRRCDISTFPVSDNPAGFWRKNGRFPRKGAVCLFQASHEKVCSKWKMDLIIYNMKEKRLVVQWYSGTVDLNGSPLHPPKQTWNLKMHPWKRRFLLETIISRFHVNFWGCIVVDLK